MTLAFRAHLIAHPTSTGPDPELARDDAAFFLGTWAGALLSVWGTPSIEIDWRLAKISRRHQTLALRATTEDDYCFRLVLFLNGQRAVRLTRVYFETFESVMTRLQDHLEVEDLSPDQPIAEEHHDGLLEILGEEPGQVWLLRLLDGESPRQAYRKAGRQQATQISAVADAAGLTPDVDLLERFFTGSLTRQEVEGESDWDNFGDLLLFIEALGLPGIKQQLQQETEDEEEAAREPEPEGDADDATRDEADDGLDARRRKLRRIGKSSLGCGCLLFLAAVAALMRYGSQLAGGYGIFGALLAIVLLLMLVVRWVWRRFTKRLETAFGGDSLVSDDVPPAVLHRWRSLFLDWRDLVFRCGEVPDDGEDDSEEKPKIGLFDALYSDLGLPVDPAGRRLVERLVDEESSMASLAREVTDLRLALVDAEVLGIDTAPEQAKYRALCDRLLAEPSEVA
ncbi:MAG: hypothetical protein AAF657_21900 [Acidobacteriota bacterium]